MAEGLLASTNVPTADDFFTLVGVVPNLDEPEARLESSVEYPGFASLIRSPSMPSAYFVGSGEAPTLRRYDLGEDGVTPGPELSMAAYGLTYAPGPTETAFGPDGLGYSVNYDNEIVIVWNPDEMVIVRTIALDGLTRDGYSSVYPLAVVIRDGHLLFPVSYGNYEKGAGLPLTVLGAIDLATDTVALAEDERCSGIRSLIPASLGSTPERARA